MHAGSAQGMPGQGFGRCQGGHAFAKDLTQGCQLAYITDRCAGAVGVDVVDGGVHRGQGLAHAAHRTLSRGRHHVITIGSGAVAHQFGIDRSATAQGMLPLFQHYDAATA